MIRPFALSDIAFVHRLQSQSLYLAVDPGMIGFRSPLFLAFTAPVPWFGLGVATYVLRDRSSGQSVAGFAQMCKRTGRPEADLIYIAPHLGDQSEQANPEIWQNLLAHCARQAGGQGLQRLYAAVPDEAADLLELFQQAGFSLYARDTLYRRPPAALTLEIENWAGIRPQQEGDHWPLIRLYDRLTPQLVRSVEGTLIQGKQRIHPAEALLGSGYKNGFVLEEAGEIVGVVWVRSQRQACHLRLLVDDLAPRSARYAELLLACGLSALPHSDQRPVYCAVRDYQGGLVTSLERYGFMPWVERALLVKHMVVTAKKPARKALDVLPELPLTVLQTQGNGQGREQLLPDSSPTTALRSTGAFS
ncbi:MAG TPA: hypothetical protein EYP04_10255 [Anaerolineae bacterium]|nr:hypothetical protein [Anaerolineae bacterium]